jgi:SAM-dependent methyltransferase
LGARTESSPSAPFPLDADTGIDVARIRDVIAGHGFLGPAVRAALGSEIGPAHVRKDLPLYLRRLAAPAPLHTLIKLFSLDLAVSETEARAALSPVPVDDAIAAGLLERTAEGVASRVGLSTHGELLLAHDRARDVPGQMNADHVLGTNAPALTLDHLTVRRSIRTALDLGCGGGVQSLLVARHADRVTAVDKNPRAVVFGRFNARMDRVTNVEWLEGDLFAPVEGRRFDLVVCNPPYVISPDSRYIFMDSGRPADAICEEVVRTVPRYLEEGGFATVLCNWALRKDDTWSAPLERWTSGSGCDAWLLLCERQDPLTYAAVWNRSREPGEYSEALDRWLAYYRASGIEEIAMGAVVLRRRSGRTWTRCDELPGNPRGPSSEHILRVFAAQDRLHALADDTALLDEAFRLVDDHRLEQTLACRNHDYVVEQAEIRLEAGLGFRGTVDPFLLHLLRGCDGTRPLRALLNDLATRGGVDRGTLTAGVVSAVRALAALGFLVVAGARDEKASDERTLKDGLKKRPKNAKGRRSHPWTSS